jgi:hypothetical protein
MVLWLLVDCDEEAALLGWFRQRMAAGKTGKHVVPLYFK